MIEATHPQAVLVYTSPARHLAAIEIAGRHHVAVMVEKPLALSLEEALSIRRIAAADHIPVLVNYETTWYASNAYAAQAVAGGRLGPLRKLVFEDGHQGPQEIGVQPEFLRWLTDPGQNGAGALYDFGCYGVDLATWLMHGATPLSVTAVTRQIKPEVYPRVDDDAILILAYPGAEAVIQGSWNWPFSRKDMQVYGASGALDARGGDRIELRLQGETSPRALTPPPLAPPQDNSLDYLQAVLAGRLRPGGDPSSLETNVIVMQILDAARTSARTGRTVPLAPLPK
jgi:predicted dehydrogenase